MLKIGTQAPQFTLKDQEDKEISLSSYLGKKVVLYFYPRDNTPGCTRQACAFRDLYKGFLDKNIQVIGISRDSVESHKKFAEKYQLPFIILADKDLEIIKAYDVWQEKKTCGKVSMGVVRTTYIIDENGIIQNAQEKVKPDTNPQEILNML
ncbi:MAG: thioredoxin-dependent thiol peroxidase [Clostridia bacterium]|nr:thioredoxin-dependent thiol peroxidase [Clostridia bacterium]